MNRIFNITITAGTPDGTFSVYYDNISSSSLATKYLTTEFATGLTFSELITGVLVVVPDTSKKILLYNNLCGLYNTINISDPIKTYPCFCLSITNSKTNTLKRYTFCYNGNSYNGKPEYFTTINLINYYARWNFINQYWELDPIPDYPSLIIRSSDPKDTPLTGWFVFGNNAQFFSCKSTEGQCESVDKTYSIKCNFNSPSCVNENDGSITSVATGGNPPWQYSLDNVNFINVGIFNGLFSGAYTVYAKDSSGNTTSCDVTLSPSQPKTYQVPMIVMAGPDRVGTTINDLTKYKIDFTIDTSLLPVGVNIEFDYVVTYTKTYSEPGTVSFITTGHSISVNNIQKTMSLIDSGPFINISTSQCNPIHDVYAAYDIYSATAITGNNTSNIVGYIEYTIDIDPGFTFDPLCYTRGTVGINAYLSNITVDNDCVIIQPTTIIETTTQIPQQIPQQDPNNPPSG